MGLPDLCELFEKMVIALGQVNVAINFHRRWPILSNMMGDGKRAQSILVKEEQTLKEDPEDLFGKEFDKALGDLVKRKRDSKELKKALHQPSKPFRGSYSRPFRGGPSARGGASGGQSISGRFNRESSGYFNNNNNNNNNNNQGRQDAPRGRGRGEYRPTNSYRARYSTVKVCYSRGVRFPAVKAKCSTPACEVKSSKSEKSSPKRPVKYLPNGENPQRISKLGV